MTTNTPLVNQLGAALRAHRLNRSEGMGTVAKRFGSARSSIAQIERAIGNPTLSRVERLADAYDVDVTITVTPRT